MESYACKICLMLMAPFFPSKNSSKNCGCIFPLPHIMGWLIYYIPANWRKKLKSTDFRNHNQISSSDSSNMNITTPSAYAAILDYFLQPPTSETKILGYCFTKESLTNVYMLPFLIKQEVKLQMFQLKIVHNLLPTRRSLFRERLSDSESCRVCQTESETFPHILFQ